MEPTTPESGGPDSSLSALSLKKKVFAEKSRKSRAEITDLRKGIEPGVIKTIPFINERIVNSGEVPPVGMTETGQGLRPMRLNAEDRNKLTMEERKERFLMFYDWSCGNVGFACQEAGVLRYVFYNWMKNKKFNEAVVATEDSIVDRMHMRLISIVGMTGEGPKKRVTEALLIALIKRFRPDFFRDVDVSQPEPDGKEIVPESQVPRPARTTGKV